jgi:inositol phosphorylceramide mannosyltransferase catalytic subunit
MTTLIIPKLFHWIWFGPKPLPEQHQRWIDGWLELHPGWNHKIWTNVNRRALINEAQFQAASSFSQKADVVRFEIVHRYGGIYLDTDTECLRCIEPLLAGVDAFAVEGRPQPVEGLPHTVENSPIGATPGHPWLADVIARLPGSMEAGWGTMHRSGPWFLSRVTIGRPDVTIFEEQLFTSEPADQSTRISEAQRACAYSIHHSTASWTAGHRSHYETKLRQLMTQDVEPLVPPGSLFLLVNKGEILETSGGRRCLPFPECDGAWSGYPADDAEAISELQRLRRAGAKFIVFPTYMAYWFDTYPGLEAFLLTEGRRVVDNHRAVIFDLYP